MSIQTPLCCDQLKESFWFSLWNQLVRFWILTWRQSIPPTTNQRPQFHKHHLEPHVWNLSSKHLIFMLLVKNLIKMNYVIANEFNTQLLPKLCGLVTNTHCNKNTYFILIVDKQVLSIFSCDLILTSCSKFVSLCQNFRLWRVNNNVHEWHEFIL